MKLTQLLIKVGLMHGPAEPEGAAPAAQAAEPSEPTFEKRILKLEELRAQAGEAKAAQEERDLGLGKTFDQIYQEKGIAPTPKGLSLSELHALVEGKSDAEARALLTRAITDKGAKVNEVLLEAQQRDAALDEYEELLGVRVERWAEAAKRKAESLREQAQHLLSEAKATEERIEEIRAKADAWRTTKHAAEDEVERLARLLLDDKDEKA